MIKNPNKLQKIDSKYFNSNLQNKNCFLLKKGKDVQEKRKNEKERECGICTQKVITTVHPTTITFEEIVQTEHQ